MRSPERTIIFSAGVDVWAAKPMRRSSSLNSFGNVPPHSPAFYIGCRLDGRWAELRVACGVVICGYEAVAPRSMSRGHCLRPATLMEVVKHRAVDQSHVSMPRLLAK